MTQAYVSLQVIQPAIISSRLYLPNRVPPRRGIPLSSNPRPRQASCHASRVAAGRPYSSWSQTEHRTSKNFLASGETRLTLAVVSPTQRSPTSAIFTSAKSASGFWCSFARLLKEEPKADVSVWAFHLLQADHGVHLPFSRLRSIRAGSIVSGVVN